MVKQPTPEELERMREEYRRQNEKDIRISRLIMQREKARRDAARRQRLQVA